jgi:tRNA U34 5-carboxymethylaminomethyl modifying GTPase MnmE/TrmE
MTVILYKIQLFPLFKHILKGDLKNLYDNWRQRVIEALAYTNAVIDFGEEEMDVADTILPGKR